MRLFSACRPRLACDAQRVENGHSTLLRVDDTDDTERSVLEHLIVLAHRRVNGDDNELRAHREHHPVAANGQRIAIGDTRGREPCRRQGVGGHGFY